MEILIVFLTVCALFFGGAELGEHMACKKAKCETEKTHENEEKTED